MTNQTTRVLELLKMFNKGDTVVIDDLKHHYLWEGLSEKTIRRDIDVIRNSFRDNFYYLRGIKGGYRIGTVGLIDNFIDSKMISLVSLLYNISKSSSLFNSLNINNEDKMILENQIKQYNKCYEFINRPFENIKAKANILKELEFSIVYSRKAKIKYKTSNGKIKIYNINPYRILFMNENFYLASFLDKFELFRIVNIIDVQINKQIFHKKLDILNFIKNIQTPFAKYSDDYAKNYIIVKILVNSSKAIFFKNKKFFPSQRIDSINEDGSIVVSYAITQNIEIVNFLLGWIDSIQILEPLNLRQEIDNIVKDYIKKRNIDG